MAQPEGAQGRGAIAALTAALGDDLLSGQVAVVLAPPGVGKTALLVHAALASMLEGRRVLHVAVSDTVDHVRAHYEQVTSVLGIKAAELLQAERNRMIHSYLDKTFEVAQLKAHLKILSEVAQFAPDLVVVDGMDDQTARASVADLVALAGDLGVPLWMSMRLIDGAIPDEVRAAGTVGVRLTPRGGLVHLSVLREGAENPIDLVLSADAALIPASRAGSAGAALDPSTVTLYAGGARGAEAAFGELAAQYGLNEVNFTFPEHKQDRTVGSYELSPRELAAGDVSLVYVSRRLNRTYSTEGTLIRKVLQMLWHMVSRSQKVLVVGAIQDDGTVVGGTGWSVELARMWNKDLWVYDQEQRGWFHWDGHRWEPGETTLDALHVCGTGTRYLEPHGRAALEELFARSFPER
ncbi:MAG: hypothetical protein R3F61_30905 [Myxococcota bacterium]